MIPSPAWQSSHISVVSPINHIAINFTVFEVSRDFVYKKFYCTEDNNSNSKVQVYSLSLSLLCGLWAGLCAMTITFPFDLVQRRMALEGMHGEKRLYTSTQLLPPLFHIMICLKQSHIIRLTALQVYGIALGR